MSSWPETGDAFLTSSQAVSRLSRAIAWASTGRGEVATLATHIGAIESSTIVTEAQAAGICRNHFENRRRELNANEANWCVITPPIAFRPTEKERMLDFMASVVRIDEDGVVDESGWKYSRAELVLQLGDTLLEKFLPHTEPILFFRYLGRILPSRNICSGFVGRLYNTVGLGPSWLPYANPDELYDWMIKEGWLVRMCSEGWQYKHENIYGSMKWHQS